LRSRSLIAAPWSETASLKSTHTGAPPPLWNTRNEREKAALRAWFIERLDARDVKRVNRNQENFLKWFATLPSRREAEKRAKWPQPVEFNQYEAIRQMRAESDKAQWRAGNPEPLRRHYPEIAEILQDGPRPEPGQHSAQTRRKDAERLRRRAQAIADYRFLSDLWGARGQWTGKEGARLLAIEVAATRHGLPPIEVEKATAKM
jgi:hypothetical protein